MNIRNIKIITVLPIQIAELQRIIESSERKWEIPFQVRDHEGLYKLYVSKGGTQHMKKRVVSLLMIRAPSVGMLGRMRNPLDLEPSRQSLMC